MSWLTVVVGYPTLIASFYMNYYASPLVHVSLLRSLSFTKLLVSHACASSIFNFGFVCGTGDCTFIAHPDRGLDPTPKQINFHFNSTDHWDSHSCSWLDLLLDWKYCRTLRGWSHGSESPRSLHSHALWPLGPYRSGSFRHDRRIGINLFCKSTGHDDKGSELSLLQGILNPSIQIK